MTWPTEGSPQPYQQTPPAPPAPTRPVQPGQPGAAGRIYVSRSAVTNRLAVLSLVFAFVFSPLGAVFGHLAKKRIKDTGEAGDGLATAGLVVSYLSIGLILLGGAYVAEPVASSGLPMWKAMLLGIVEGVTEFLPVSSTGHLTITEKLLHTKIDDKGVTAFTAIIQVGAILAAIVYFWRDIVRIVGGFFRGLVSAEGRRSADWRMALYVIVGSIPVAVVGLGAKDVIEGALRSLWFVAAALIGWCVVMWIAERAATQRRGEADLGWTDAIVIGLAQCLALIPGVSRSGATISVGLMRGLDRVAATRLSFFLGIPALAAAGALEAVTRGKEVGATVGWGATLVATVVSFVVAYASIAWLLKFVAHHSIVNFVWYRVLVGVTLIGLLATGVIAAT
jgi:undecaprenyl-diphosphatase